MKNHKISKKVIHIEKNGNIEKSELYTELYTLSTEKNKKNAVYIVKKGTSVLWRCPKVDKIGKKREKMLTF